MGITDEKIKSNRIRFYIFLVFYLLIIIGMYYVFVFILGYVDKNIGSDIDSTNIVYTIMKYARNFIMLILASVYIFVILNFIFNKERYGGDSMNKALALVVFFSVLNLPWNFINKKSFKDGENQFFSTSFITLPNRSLLLIGKKNDQKVTELFLPYCSYRVDGKEITKKNAIYFVDRQKIFSFNELTKTQRISYLLTLQYIQDNDSKNASIWSKTLLKLLIK